MACGADDATILYALELMVQRSCPDMGLCWGAAIAGTEHYGDSGYGHLRVVTATGTAPLTRRMVEAAARREIMVHGAMPTRLYVPDAVCDVPSSAVLPMVDLAITIPTQHGVSELHLQLPWELAVEYPLAILTTDRLEGWP